MFENFILLKVEIELIHFLRREGGRGTVGKHTVVFALNVNFLNRAPALQALCIVSQTWSTWKITI
jgi:hypothetical protein